MTLSMQKTFPYEYTMQYQQVNNIKSIKKQLKNNYVKKLDTKFIATHL
mgnify:CR=1 FL=1